MAGEWVTPAEMDGIRPGLALFRNHDKAFMDRLDKSETARKIGVEMSLTETPNGYRLEIHDEDGVKGSSRRTALSSRPKSLRWRSRRSRNNSANWGKPNSPVQRSGS